MTDGKNAVGLTGFPTPNAAGSLAGYLLFLFEDKEYAQWILGAAEALTNEYNYYKSGDLEPDEAAEMFRVIVQDAPYNLRTCPNPAGGKIFRVNKSGKVEEYSDAGEWQDPTGDATIPPVPEREGGTPDDQMCLAAKNATNVLQQLYENLTDSFNAHLDEAEAATAMTLTLVSLIGAEFAPITFALVTFFAIVFSVLYGVLEFVAADLWDETFSDALACILLGCATNIDGVVTFDWDCFNNALAEQVNVFDLTFEQLRLFGQLQYILLVIGGVDALNAAGATTAIEDDDCSFCDTEHCFQIDFSETDGSESGVVLQGGTYETDCCLQGADFGTSNHNDLFGYWAFPSVIHVIAIEVDYIKQNGAGGNNQTHFRYLYPTATGYSTVSVYDDTYNPVQDPVIERLFEPNQDLAGIGFDINTGDTFGPVQMKRLLVRYTGDEVFGGDNC